MEVGLESESGARAVGDAGVDLGGTGEGGFSLTLFKIGQELAAALSLGIALQVVDLLQELFLFIFGPRGIEIFTGLGKITFLNMEAGLEKSNFGSRFGLGIIFEKGGDAGEGFGQVLFSLGGFLGRGAALGRVGLDDVVGGLF